MNQEDAIKLLKTYHAEDRIEISATNPQDRHASRTLLVINGRTVNTNAADEIDETASIAECEELFAALRTFQPDLKNSLPMFHDGHPSIVVEYTKPLRDVLEVNDMEPKRDETLTLWAKTSAGRRNPHHLPTSTPNRSRS